MGTFVVSLTAAVATSAALIKFNAMHGSTLTLCLIVFMAFLLPALGNRHSKRQIKRAKHPPSNNPHQSIHQDLGRNSPAARGSSKH